jgi:Lon protease-like protein
MTEMPMFPLGSVLFPNMPLPLRVFEERYLVMLAHILEDEPAEFGVVLIERGQEVGGGEQRFRYGTIARITQIEAADGFVALIAQGDRRIEVTEWMPEDPYPQASVRILDDLVWDETLVPLRDRAEKTVRRILAQASEFGDQPWSANVELSDDPMISSWQLAGIAPIGPLDQVSLLRSATTAELLELVISCSEAAADSFRSGWSDADEEFGDLDT